MNRRADLRDRNLGTLPVQSRNADRRIPGNGRLHRTHKVARNRNVAHSDPASASPVVQSDSARSENSRRLEDFWVDRCRHHMIYGGPKTMRPSRKGRVLFTLKLKML